VASKKSASRGIGVFDLTSNQGQSPLKIWLENNMVFIFYILLNNLQHQGYHIYLIWYTANVILPLLTQGCKTEKNSL